MKAELTSEEILILSKYRLASDLPTGKKQSEISGLMNDHHLSLFLEDCQKRFEIRDSKTAASHLMKRFAFLAVIYLYSMTVFNKQLLVQPGNIKLVDTEKPGWLPEFYFISKSCLVCPEGKRNEWRMEATMHLFQDLLHPAIDALSKAVKIPKFILWENIAVYIFWVYEKVLPEILEEKMKNQAAEDFNFLLHTAPGRTYGNVNYNPLIKFYSEPVINKETGNYVRVRKTCCFSYRLKDGEFCSNCPLACKQER